MVTKSFLTRDDLVKLDKELKLIPLTFDKMFKNVFTYDLDIFKEFLILETNLDLDIKSTNISLLNNELPKGIIKEYQKTIDIYVSLNDNTRIDVELNNASYNDLLSIRNSLYESKLFSMSLESGESIKELANKKIIQLNLNTKDLNITYGEDILMTYGIKTGNFYLKNRQIILKYLAYYKKMYYNFDIKLSKSELWLVVILSESFTELYDLLGELLSDIKRDKFIRKVIEMSKDTFILHEWEKEKMDELTKLAYEEDGHKRGLEQGIQQGFTDGANHEKREIAKNLLKENVSLDLISKSTGLSHDEIEKLKTEI